MKEGIPSPTTIITRILSDRRVEDADEVAQQIERALLAILRFTPRVYIGHDRADATRLVSLSDLDHDEQ